MSYILDALNKSEQERQEEEGHAPNLQTIHGQVDKPARATRVKVWSLAGVIAIALGIYAAFPLFSGSSTREPPMPEVNATAPTSGSWSNNSKPSTWQATTESSLPVTGPQGVENRIQGLYAAEAKAAEARTQQQNKVQKQNSSQIQAMAELLADEETRRLAEQIRTPSPQVLSLRELSSGLRQRLPAIHYTAHIFSAGEDSGFVILNGRKRFAGDIVAPELFVKRVRENDVVLNFRGTEFSLEAMRSWQPQ